MRYKGKSLRGPKTEVLAIPRDDGDIIFIGQAIMDFEEFDLICPTPLPPNKLIPGDPPRQVPNAEDPDYKKQLNLWGAKKRDWMILKSLSSSPDLEWEQVDFTNPDTFCKYIDELRDSGFNNAERNLIIGLALKVNSVDEDKMEEARARFLASRAGQPVT